MTIFRRPGLCCNVLERSQVTAGLRRCTMASPMDLMQPFMDGVGEDQAGMLAIAVALGAARVAGWSDAEAALTAGLRPAAASAIRRVKEQIDAGNDPLGDWFCRLRSPQERRPQGATYTPDAIVLLLGTVTHFRGEQWMTVPRFVPSVRLRATTRRSFCRRW